VQGPPGGPAANAPKESTEENERIPEPERQEVDIPEFDLDSEEDVRCFLADIVSGEPQREARGYQRISQMGAQAVDPLYLFLSQTDDAHAGRVCARFLQSLAPDLQNRIQRDLERRTVPSIKLRLLQYAVPLLEQGPWQSLLMTALHQEDEAVAREALHQLETSFPAEASRMLLEVLPACPDNVRYEVCVSIGQLGDSRCVPQLLGYLDKATGGRENGADRFSEGLCYALGHFSDPQVVQKLGQCLSPNGKLPWRKKKAHPGLRKAAFMALEKIGGNSVYAVLKKHEHDKDPWIRFRVRNYLKGKPPLPSEGH
jgi:hypothetical protein